ncbi:putative disease resistance RPP13-like protein 3 isoform X1 [Panicum miliaceum]|uniref:Disease resistance RPP13-like protein 3 isoform X1 n=1 Tax=Panicum miliaceum TaxID=4540 RepID=A0A3L6PF74_PANMI|nr:putative disease resistance RPP13-like protein 3 isoform X1 [Panicum miliaceum]
MGILGPKLLDLLRHEYKLQTGVEKEARSLSLEMDHIDAFLRKVAGVPWDQLDEQVKVWGAREVREASYDMEDALDSFSVHVEDGEAPPDDDDGQTVLGRLFRMIADMFIKVKPRRDIAVLIEGIKKQLQEIAERRARYRIDDGLVKPVAATSSAVDPRLAAMYHEADQIIGIDKPMTRAISMLVLLLEHQHGNNGVPDAEDRKQLKKVSVVGVGGLGKTTLAKAVYEKLKGDFDCGAFVPVGRNPDLKRVFKDILLDLDEEEYDKLLKMDQNPNMPVLDERLLINKIREFLKDKRYFIVIDDIWEKQSWGIIKLVLVEDNCGSGIITTTRNSEVAKETGEVYKLQPLPYHQSRKLFYTRIFGSEGKCPGVQSDEISDKILKKRDGAPLAIITMASLLVGKPREIWSELYSNIGFGQHADNTYVENTTKILSFSYYDLPSHLRTRLLYLSAFPEDYVIEKDPLIWKWIAEGFVYKEQGTNGLYKEQGTNGLFELGERYFNDLINRSMIQAVESAEYDGIIEGCRVHDMVLDLIRSLSRHENSVTILDINTESISSQNITSSFDRWVPLLSFKLLRVLALEDCEFDEGCFHMENLGSLLHLRSLSLKNIPYGCELPKEMGNLRLLQTIDFEHVGSIELPASIIRLTQLKCLSFGDEGIKRVPDGIGKLTSLEQLKIYFRCGSNDYQNNVRMFVKELGSLGELRVLEIKFLFLNDSTVQRCLAESLRNLHKIQHIKLLTSVHFYADADMAMREATGSMLPQHLICHLSLQLFRFPRLPSWINRLHHLSFLSLRVVTVDEQDLKLLGSLRELRYLNLVGMEATATVSKINAGDGFFQELRWFVMRHDGNGDCSSIGLEHLKSLQKVGVRIQCQDASDAEVEEAEAELRCAINHHPNRPTFEIHRWFENKMSSSVQDQQELEDNSLPTEEEENNHDKDDRVEDKGDEEEDDDTVTRKRRTYE